ncbi:hypothetical protein BWI93_16535, partial [Siphonobacter sp. BAB-5385]|uniref:hypothetical protein n=1 Tax=Siphonobacter sp. BAB-5385 TaxID=1864822 RepID=UPI000BC604DB
KIQEVPIDEIALYFYESKLAAIIISFGHTYNYTKLQFDQVNYGLKNTFGKPYLDCQTGINDVIDCDVWQGKKVILEHNRLRDSDGK